MSIKGLMVKVAIIAALALFWCIIYEGHQENMANDGMANADRIAKEFNCGVLDDCYRTKAREDVEVVWRARQNFLVDGAASSKRVDEWLCEREFGPSVNGTCLDTHKDFNPHHQIFASK